MEGENRKPNHNVPGCETPPPPEHMYTGATLRPQERRTYTVNATWGCLVGKLETLQQWVLGGEMHNHLGARKKCHDGRR